MSLPLYNSVGIGNTLLHYYYFIHFIMGCHKHTYCSVICNWGKLKVNGQVSKNYSVIGQIMTHDSESQGQEEAGCMQQTSELFTGSTTLKLVNALNKLLLKLSLSYQGLSTF